MKFIIAAIICLLSIPVIAQESWYKCLSGKIDKYAVTVHLHKQQQQYSGCYYYNNTQQPIYFSGEDSSASGKIKLTAFLPDREMQETLVFSFNEKNCVGSWISSTGKTLPFSAVELTQTPAWDYVFTTDSLKLRSTIQESPIASYEAAAVWPKDNSDQSLFLKKMISKWYAADSSGIVIEDLFLNEKKQFFDDYISENKDVADSDLVNTYSFNMDESQTIQVVYQSAELLTLSNAVYSYTGGAHGNYGTSYIAVDLVHNKELSLNDILSEPGKKQLKSLLEKYFRKAYDLKNTDALTEGGLFENKIEPNENFFVTGKGLGFDYTPYEIGPYAMGEIVIFIPFAELQTYLQSDFKTLLNN